ncbi:MAG: hypothetical protein JSV54_09215 [Chloroflexota bacterium]|nr:MAG: hypothetical protein JSV54_09215 [Chloroflexota bacterium]
MNLNPVDYLGDLMMGVLVASTAFCGLTGILIGQIKVGRLVTVRGAVGGITASFVLGIIAILAAILWFSAPMTDISLLSTRVIAPWSLFLQILLFTGVVVDLWFT